MEIILDTNIMKYIISQHCIVNMPLEVTLPFRIWQTLRWEIWIGNRDRTTEVCTWLAPSTGPLAACFSEESQPWFEGTSHTSSQGGVAGGRFTCLGILWAREEFCFPRSPWEAAPLSGTNGRQRAPCLRRRAEEPCLPERVGERDVDAEVTVRLVDTVHAQPQASGVATACCKGKDREEL